MNYLRKILGASAAMFVFCNVTHAQPATVVVGVTVSSTGPAASLGIPQKNTIELLPDTLGGLPVKYVVLDDATDPTHAVKNAHRFVDIENVDVIIGSSTTANSMAVAQVANEAKVPQLGLAPYPINGNAWAFSVPQNFSVMYHAIFQHMKKRGIKNIAFIGFSDALGDAGLKEVKKFADQFAMKLVANERYARTDQSVTAQALKIIQSKPDAVVFSASGTGAALPMYVLRQKGYKGAFYQNHGVANNDFLRVAGASGDGMICPTGLVLVAEQLPDSTPSKKVALGYLAIYEGKYGPGSRNPFGAYAYDAYLLLQNAVAKVAKTANPGTPQFRAGLRDALENTHNLALTHGISNMSADNHSGLGKDAVAMITIEHGHWKLVE